MSSRRPLYFLPGVLAQALVLLAGLRTPLGEHRRTRLRMLHVHEELRRVHLGMRLEPRHGLVLVLPVRPHEREPLDRLRERLAGERPFADPAPGGVLVAEHRHLDLLGQLLGRHPAHVGGVGVVVVAPHPELLNLAPVRRLPAGERVVPDAHEVIDLRVESLLGDVAGDDHGVGVAAVQPPKHAPELVRVVRRPQMRVAQRSEPQQRLVRRRLRR